MKVEEKKAARQLQNFLAQHKTFFMRVNGKDAREFPEGQILRGSIWHGDREFFEAFGTSLEDMVRDLGSQLSIHPISKTMKERKKS